MPIYQYRCPTCGRREDGFARVSDRHLSAPLCLGHGQMGLEIMPTYVQADIAPYRAVVNDIKTGKPPVIGGRKQHREFLKRNRLVEAGPPKDTSRMQRIIKTDADRRSLREQMRPVVTQALRRGRA